jgi:copper chaperone CopZ
MCGTTNTTTGDLGLTDKNHACNCGSTDHTNTAQPATAHGDVVREHFLVEGMTCAHCVASVTEEVSDIDGVQNVQVELNVGGASKVMVESATPIDPARVDAAVKEAGYTLVQA